MARHQPRASFDHYAGYHSFKADDGSAYGSFEVFYMDRTDARIAVEADRAHDPDAPPTRCGWYWHACVPGCMPDGEPMGPYTSSRAAWRAARED